MRPAEVILLVGDPSKAMRKLGWQPAVTFRELVQIMVDADLEANQRNAHAPRVIHGRRAVNE